MAVLKIANWRNWIHIWVRTTTYIAVTIIWLQKLWFETIVQLIAMNFFKPEIIKYLYAPHAIRSNNDRNFHRFKGSMSFKIR